MIVNNEAIKIESNVQTESLKFGISDTRIVLNVLSKLYAHPIRTLVQEYICNGRDAMREAGTWGKIPMRIGVPNAMEPRFVVRDFGVGISPDRMQDIFVNYGSSTKRNNNNETGGFGIGAKSAFAYTDSFSITSYYNGTQYVYVAHLTNDGGVELVSKIPTKEPNGVEISLGVKTKDLNDFRGAVERCVRFWQEELDIQGWSNIERLTPTLTLGNITVFNSGLNEPRSIYLIDGVEYDLMGEDRFYSSNQKPYFQSAGSIVAINVPNGHLKPAYSRERIETNDDNQAKQDKLVDNVKTLLNSVTKEINNPALSLDDRIAKKLEYSGFHTIASIQIELGNGYRLHGSQLYIPSPLTYRYVRSSRRSRKDNFETNTTTRLATDLNVIIDTSGESAGSNKVLARKLNYYLSQNRSKQLVQVENTSVIPFCEKLFTVIKSETLPLPPVLPKQQRPTKSVRDAIVWCVHDGGRSQTTVEKLNKIPTEFVLIDEVTPESKELNNLIPIYIVPKCNKSLVTAKGLTIEQAKKHLLKKHKDSILSLPCLPYKFKEIKVLSKFTMNSTFDSNLRSYLFKYFPDIKKEYDAFEEEYAAIVKKYPLISVINKLGHYESEAKRILIDEINKQSKEN